MNRKLKALGGIALVLLLICAPPAIAKGGGNIEDIVFKVLLKLGLIDASGAPTAGASSLADTLAVGNTSSGTDLVMSSGDVLQADDGNAAAPGINLGTANTGFYGVTTNVVISADGNQMVTVNPSGVTISSNASVGLNMSSGQVLAYKRDIEDVTANNTIGTSECSRIYTNVGAVGARAHTLPVGEAGMQFTFMVAAAQNIEIDPQASDHFIYSGGAMADGEKLISNTIGSSLTVTCISDGNWFVTGEQGTWVEETP